MRYAGALDSAIESREYRLQFVNQFDGKTTGNFGFHGLSATVTT